MNKNFILVFLFLGSILLFAQETKKDSITDEAPKVVVSKEKLRELHLDALPYYSFGKGVGITSPDSLFQFNIRFRMQNRLEASFVENDNAQYKAAIRRLRLRFDGYIGSPKFVYSLQLSFAPEDVGRIKENSTLNVIRDAIVFYQHSEKFSIGFGQTKLPGNRQRVNSSGALDLTDRSINNAMYNIDRDFGLQAIFSNSRKEKFGYNLKTAISTGEGRNFIDKTDGLAYTGRLELYPIGRFKKNGEFFEGDLQREQTPKLYIGGSYHYNHKANKTQGTLGEALHEHRDLQSVLLDAMLKYKGWSGMLAYMSRSTDDPITYKTPSTLSNDIKNMAFVRVGNGFDAQLSYIFPSNWEIIGRFSNNQPHQKIEHLLPRHQQISMGITKYIWEHAFKAQFEVSNNDFTYIDGRKDNNWYARLQVEIGI